LQFCLYREGAGAGLCYLLLALCWAPDEEDDFDFEERFTALKAEFEEELQEEERLNRLILENLKKIEIK
jgi:hypothetical protein